MSKQTSPANKQADTHLAGEFYDYYAEKSLRPEMQANIASIYGTVMGHRGELGLPTDNLAVVDIGCNAGVQCMYWASHGHRLHGIDIGADFVELARQRAETGGVEIDFRVGTAADLPWPDDAFDVCLLPELLEHVPNWEDCLSEVVRVTRPGGSLFISTTNYLCPSQQEFSLPLYSWYPQRLKRWCEKKAVTSHPQWVNHASHPAVNWFSYYSLSSHLRERGFRCVDRFALVQPDSGRVKRAVSRVIGSNAVFRFVGQVLTPYTVTMATKH